MGSHVRELDELIRNEDEDLPFRRLVDVHAVLKVIAELRESGHLDSNVRSSMRLWMRWHCFVHSGRDSEALARIGKLLEFSS